MSPETSAELQNWLNLIFRWLHVIAGVMWIGHLWFFNFVNAQVAKTYDADSKKKVIPELMPRALYWFRWGAAYTFITGILLLGLVYYMGGSLIPQTGSKVSLGVGTAIGLGMLVIAWVIYDVMWKAMAKQEMAGMVVSFLLVSGVAFGLQQVFVGRAVYVHIGAIFGTIMASNVWMRIWPNQRRIITAIKEGKAPDAAWAGLAGLRSKHNTYMSMPLMFFMISNHYPTVYGHDFGWAFIPGFVALGWVIAKLCFNKSGAKAPTLFQIELPAAAPAPAAAAGGDKK
jgi:uncharacterized membrane protein